MPELLLSCIGLLTAALGAWMLWKSRRTPEERERHRRLMVHRHGRMGEAVVTDYRDDILHYEYEVRGVAYVASQQVTALRPWLPPDPASLIGQAAIKYHPKNPANSILLCEEWSGLRTALRSVCKEEEEKEIA